MIQDLIFIAEYIKESFINIWPYLLVTIPIAVAVQMSGASTQIRRAFTAKPILAIFLATLVGAFSPLCSCGVIPVVAALLLGGVPLAPVMSFWLASPSMDPEIFFLTVSTLGWNLAVWRLGSTLALSLGGGFVVHGLTKSGWIGDNILRSNLSTETKTTGQVLVEAWQSIKAQFAPSNADVQPALVVNSAVCEQGACALPQQAPVLLAAAPGNISLPQSSLAVESADDCGCEEETSISLPIIPIAEDTPSAPFWPRLRTETTAATWMVIKFMMLAWFLGALIQLYVPQEWISSVLGKNNPWAILTAALFGVPVYTSNLIAMPLVGGLLSQGMHPAAGLAFLISGPMTTLPAMSAVWGIVEKKIFILYIAFALVGAVLIGYIYNLALLLSS